MLAEDDSAGCQNALHEGVGARSVWINGNLRPLRAGLSRAGSSATDCLGLCSGARRRPVLHVPDYGAGCRMRAIRTPHLLTCGRSHERAEARGGRPYCAARGTDQSACFAPAALVYANFPSNSSVAMRVASAALVPEATRSAARFSIHRALKLVSSSETAYEGLAGLFFFFQNMQPEADTATVAARRKKTARGIMVGR